FQTAECLLDLAFLELDMLAQHRIVLLDREFLGHGAGVLLGDIEKARAALAIEADLRGGGLRHDKLQETQVEGRLNGLSALIVQPFNTMPRFSSLFSPGSRPFRAFSGPPRTWERAWFSAAFPPRRSRPPARISSRR